MKPIEIAIVDDHVLFRKGLASLISDNAAFKVVFEAANGLELLRQLEQGALPDVVLLDLTMPEMDGIAALQALRLHYPSIKVLILSMNQDEAMILHVVELGANGYLLKEAEPEEVEMAMNAVMETGFYFNEHTSRAMLSKITAGDKFKSAFDGPIQLSDRELEVLDFVCRGFTNPEIAEKLFISHRTVEGHRKNIMEKMGVRNTAAMVVLAIKNGWVNLDQV